MPIDLRYERISSGPVFGQEDPLSPRLIVLDTANGQKQQEYGGDADAYQEE